MNKSVFLLLLTASVACYIADEFGGPARVDEPSLDAKSILSDLLSRSPATNATFVGTLIVRQRDGTRVSRSVFHSFQLMEAGWQDAWEAAPSDNYPGERLIVTHNGLKPNTYRYWPSLAGHTAPRELTGELLATPFAGSDFWLCDLGLEFLQWPNQRIVKNRATTTLQRPCRVLESSPNAASEQAYGKVLSWLDLETGALLRAEAFDPGGQRIKQFGVRAFRRNGSADFDIWNYRQDTKSSLRFGHER